MRKLVGASFYSGVGCADLGMLQGGVAELAWACEYDAVTADWHEANFGKHILRSPTGSCLGVCDINPYRVERPNVLWLSPECKTFSLLNKDKRKRLGHGKPLEEAKAIAHYLRIWEPEFVFIENVATYLKSLPGELLIDTLRELGYWLRIEVLNAANFRNPQERRRLIVRAIRKNLYKPVFLESELPALLPFESTPGWHEATQDISLQKTSFCNWQLAALPSLISEGCFNELLTCKPETQYFLIERVGAHGLPNVRIGKRPSWTVRALNHDRHYRQMDVLRISGDFIELAQEVMQSSYRNKNNELLKLILMSDVYAACPRFFARLQSLPDSFKLPEDKPLATQMIGNAVPVNLAAEVVKQTLAIAS